jgi:predicted metal-dependent hydrolase
VDRHAQFLKGIESFNQEDFYDCHDTVEAIWLEESSDEQPFFQGIIQSAVAFHHYQHEKWGAARSMLELAIGKLRGYPDDHHGLRLQELLGELQGWKRALDEAISEGSRGELGRAYPKIRFEVTGKRA